MRAQVWSKSRYGPLGVWLLVEECHNGHPRTTEMMRQASCRFLPGAGWMSGSLIESGSTPQGELGAWCPPQESLKADGWCFTAWTGRRRGDAAEKQVVTHFLSSNILRLPRNPVPEAPYRPRACASNEDRDELYHFEDCPQESGIIVGGFLHQQIRQRAVQHLFQGKKQKFQQ